MRTVVALYDRFEEAQRAVQALIDAKFNYEDITFIVRDATGEYADYLNRPQEGGMASMGSEPSSGAAAGAGIGAGLGGLGGVLLGLGALAIPGIGPVIAAGPIIAGLAGAGIGAVAGGLIGGLMDMGIPEEHANFYAEGVRRGGSLIVVRVKDQDADQARQILNRFHPIDIETHSQAWRQSGWSRFNPNAEPLSPEQMEFNRMAGQAVAGSQMNRMDTGTGPFDSGSDEHLAEDIYSKERSQNEAIDVPVTGGMVEEADVSQADVQDWQRYDLIFYQDYQTRFVGSEYGYDYYQPAYRYGYDLGMDPRFREYDWNRLEPEARMDYEQRGLRGAWEDVKDAVRHAWERVRGQ